MIDEILTQPVPTPHGLVESVLRRVGVAHLASLHPSPVGQVVVVRSDQEVTAVAPADQADEMLSGYEERTGVPAYQEERPPPQWSDRVDEALATGRGRLVEVRLLGVTPFQRDVLAATSRIPVGQTRPYAWVARESGHGGAVRAVGSALRRNPIPLIIPCHRVIRSDGSLGRYAYGTPMKARLLTTEDAEPTAVGPLVGSQRGSVVCYPTCHHARRLTAPVEFPSVRVARQAGYRPCEHCRPV